MLTQDVSPELLRIYSRSRLEERTVSELIGICHGAINSFACQFLEVHACEF